LGLRVSLGHARLERDEVTPEHTALLLLLPQLRLTRRTMRLRHLQLLACRLG
jgi:hypothetical protein